MPPPPPPPHPVGTARPRVGTGLAGHLDAAQAAEHAAERCLEGLAGAKADLACIFVSMHHADAAGAVAHIVRRRLGPRVLIGCTAEAVIGGEVEMENAPGISVLAASLPGVRLHTFSTDNLPLPRDPESVDPSPMGQAAGIAPDFRATILLADPFSVPLNTLLPVMTAARNAALARAGASDAGRDDADPPRPGPIIGGLASASNRPGGNVLLHDDHLHRSGGVGVTLSGPVRVDALVSQGCRPVGPPLVVTGCRGQMLTGLGGRPALEALEAVLDGLPEEDRQKLRRGLYIGRAVTEYKRRFGRDDFAIRNVVGVDKAHKHVAVADLLRVGQTVQFHIRDAQTADEDLGLLLDLQKLYDEPAGVLLFTCNGRGQRLFPAPHHDAAAFARAFSQAPQPPGEVAAKLGRPFPPPGAQVPLAGFFAAGEIGPVGDQTFVHGQTACAAIFRPAS
jgi:small ligand-binding sensory domain FIST